jgi:hypothetical protein
VKAAVQKAAESHHGRSHWSVLLVPHVGPLLAGPYKKKPRKFDTDNRNNKDG